MSAVLDAAKSAQKRISERKSRVINEVTNNNPFDRKDINEKNMKASEAQSVPTIYNITKESKIGIDYALLFCDYSAHSSETVSSLSLCKKLLGDIGLEMICHYLSFGFYPHLNEINLQDNLLTDISLNYLSDLIESKVCPELRSLNLCCNYISQSVGQTFLDYCSQHSVSIEIGGCPDFALSSTVPKTHFPTLLFRAVTRNDLGNVSIDTLIYSDFYRVGQWCHMGGKPFVGIQLFYYGCGQITARLMDANGNYSFGDGECGNLILTTHLLPIVSVEFGCRDLPFYVTGFTDTTDGYLTSLKLCLVAHFIVCLKSDRLLAFIFLQ